MCYVGIKWEALSEKSPFDIGGGLSLGKPSHAVDISKVIIANNRGFHHICNCRARPVGGNAAGGAGAV